MFVRLTAIACLLVAATQLAGAATLIRHKIFDPEPFPLPDATVNVPLSYDVSHSCPANPSETNGYQWADPNAVPGLAFSPAGIISGTPTTAGTYVFSATILPSPSCDASNTGQFQLIVKLPPAPTGCTVTADGANPLALNGPKLVTLAAQCATGNPTSFAWSANAGLPNTAPGGPVQVSTTQTYTVTPSNAGGNGNAVSVTVTVPPVPSGCSVTADGANPLDLNAPKQVTLFAQCSAGNPTSFSWSANAGLPSAAAGGQVQVNSTQTFTVTPANASGAGTPVSVVVNVAGTAAPPSGCTVTADGANPLDLNAPKQVTLSAQCTAGNPTSFIWSSNAGFPVTAAGGQVQVNSTQTFTVTPANASGSGNTVSVAVNVAGTTPPPSGCSVTADGANPLDLNAPKQVTLSAQCTAGNPTSFAWSPNAGLPSTAAGGQVQVGSTQTFTVTPANASGSGNTVSVTVNVAGTAPPPPTGCTVTADGANPLNLSGPRQVALSARCATGDPTSFIWSSNAGFPVTAAGGQVQVNSTQTFTVTPGNAGGSGNIASVTVTVGALTSTPAPGSDNQVGQANDTLRRPLVLQVNDLAGNPVAAVSVSWALTVGTGTLSSPVSLTNAQGQASVTLTLGPEPGPRTVRATAAGSTPVFFTVQSAEQLIIDPTLQTATVQQLVAINAPRVQMANVRTRLDQLRQLRNPAVAQGLKLSYDGRPLPWQLLAQAVAPTQTDAAPAPADPFGRDGVFVQGDIEVGRQSNVGSASGFDLRTKGLTLGADRRFEGNHVLGVALGLLRADTTLRNDGGTQDAKGYSFSAYGSYSFAESGYVNLIGNVGRNDYDGQRNVSGGGSASASTSGTQYGVALSAGYDFDRGIVSVGPYGRVEYVHARIDAYTETGTQALGIGEQTASATFLTLGGQANWAISASWGVFQPSARLEWQYQSSGGGNIVSAQLIGQPGSNVSVQIAGQDKSYGLAAIGAQFILPHSVQAYFNFETPFGKSDYRGQRYTLGVRVGF